MAEEMRNALPLGLELDGYRLETVLGAGGFGITYLAVESFSGRKVAIKEFLPSGLVVRGADSRSVHPNSSDDKSEFDWGLDRFRQEARILITFKHANIVPVLRAFEANGTAYMVMEYQDGTSLGAILKSATTLDEAEVFEILGPLLDGLDAVHKAGFLHRDIKPDNIYIRTDGTPVLLDFGAARQAIGSRSKSLTAIVSAGYAPHEQYETDSNQGPWTDIYSLGAVLYRAVTGRRPPESSARMSATFRGDDDPMVPASIIARGQYAERLLLAIDQATKMQERERPQSIRDLRALLGDMTRIASGASTRLAAVAQQTHLIPPKPGITSKPLSAPSARMATGEPIASPAPAKKRSPALLIGGVVAVLALGAGAYALTSGSKTPGSTDPAANTKPVMIAQDDAALKARTEAEARAKAEADAQAKLIADARAKADAEAKRRADEDARMRAEIEQSRRAEAEARLRAELDAARRAEAEARAKVEAEVRAKAEFDARVKADEERRKQAEIDARLKAQADADARAKAEADAKSKAETDRKRADDIRKRTDDEPRKRADDARRDTARPQQHASLPGNEGDLARVLAGKTNYWEPTRDGKSLQMTFQPNGRLVLLKINSSRPNLRPFIGTWRIQGSDRLCMAFLGSGPNSDGQEFCVRVQKIGDEYAVLTANAGFRNRFK